ncbi:MAG: T9SS type A sorting domain-containing protein [Bacteroidales bacterium]|nr:T9SS type A sorting domain-containing protein [Bacteroidales bacterium]
MKKNGLIILGLFFIFSGVNSQTDFSNFWIEMMQDSNANFFEIQNVFNQKKGSLNMSSFKHYKRWEWYWQYRVNTDGSFPSTNKNANEYIKYFSKNKTNSGNWQNLGPHSIPVSGGGLGRINCIEFDPVNIGRAYIGTPSGGLWRTDNIFADNPIWEPLTDFLPQLGISSIVIDYINPNIIYIGTGDKNNNDTKGTGIFKSTDAGQTWFFINNDISHFLKEATVSKFVIHPENSQTLYVATNKGVYKTINGGVFWEKLDVQSSSSVSSLQINLANPDILYYANSYGFFRTTDAGKTWTKTFDRGGRVEIGTTLANPNIVYFVRTGMFAPEYWGFGGLYISYDAGETFSLQSSSPNILGWYNGDDIGGQGFYDLCIAIDPNDENRLFVGGINLWYSDDKGVSWTKKSNWNTSPYLHADQHYITFIPFFEGFNSNNLFIANDGGIYNYHTIDGNGVFYDISGNLAISQIYRIGQYANNQNFTLCGMQDNGTAYNWQNEWKKALGGDGFECLIDYTEAKVEYGSNVNFYEGELSSGFILRTIDYWSTSDRIASPISNGISDVAGWINPYKLDVNTPNTMYVGYQQLWRSTNVKTNNVDDIVWEKITNFNTYGQIADFEQSTVNSNLFYITKGKYLYKSENFSTNNIVFNQTFMSNTNIIDIALNPSDENMVYLCTAYKKIYKSSDKGQTFTDISGSLSDVLINSIVLDKNSEEAIYIGTDIGVFYKNASMTDWIPFSNGLPNVIVTELEIAYEDDNNSILKAATYGRGLWQTDLDCNNIQEQDLFITGTQQSSYWHASNNITSDAFIPVGQNVTFRAGTKITLLPGFNADRGSNFKAVVGLCEDVIKTNSKQHNIVSKLHKNFLPLTDTIQRNNNQDFLIYPNPCSNYFIVKTIFNNIDELKIFDVAGVQKLCLSNISNDMPINISYLKQGVYIVQFKINQNIYYTKIIKN